MNTTSTRRWGRRVAAALGAAALTLVGVAGAAGATPAPLPPTDSGAPTTGSLTIHKINGAETNGLNNGTAQEIAGTPLDGVTFTVTPVTAKGGTPIDLKTAAGWALIQGVDADIANVVSGTGYTLGTGTSVTTGDSVPGEATFGNLPIGLYLVQETGHANLPVVTTSAPFLVTIPLSVNNAQGTPTGGWLYDVHAYPKNQLVGEPTKSVGDPTALLAADGTVAWTVKAPIPVLNSTDSFTSFTVTDTLDPKLQYQSPATVTVAGLTLVAADYTVSATNPVTVTFTADGLAKLKTLARTAGYDGTTDVVVTITTKVLEGGSFDNYASVEVNGNTQDTNTVSTQWGYVKISKTDSKTHAALQGATFAVYATQADATAGTNALGTGVTGADGSLTFGPLWVATDNPEATKDYFVKETAVPSGYVLDPTVHTITVSAGTLASTGATTITNVKAEVPTLPITGADGQLLMMIGGGALVLLAGGTALVMARRSHRD